jgi:hypothetical protein
MHRSNRDAFALAASLGLVIHMGCSSGAPEENTRAQDANLPVTATLERGQLPSRYRARFSRRAA